MSAAHDFISNLPENQGALASFLDTVINSYPGITAKISYGIPFYYRKSWICYLNPTKDGKVEFALTRGNELSNDQGLLEARGRKQVLSVIFAKLSEVPEQMVREILQEALLLDEEVPYASKRQQKS